MEATGVRGNRDMPRSPENRSQGRNEGMGEGHRQVHRSLPVAPTTRRTVLFLAYYTAYSTVLILILVMGVRCVIVILIRGEGGTWQKAGDSAACSLP